MLKLKDLFTLNIEKEINLVIKADDQDPAQIEMDIDEYIVTDQIENLLESFFENYTLNSTEKIGVWISGFFGSGKSYFAKILGYLIENQRLQNGLTAHDRFRERLNSSDKKDFIEGQISKIEKINAKAIIFEIIKDSSSNESDTVQRIMLKKLFEKLGYSADLNVSSMEYELQRHNYYDGFKDYLAQKGLDIQRVRDNQTIFRKRAVDYLVEKQGFDVGDAKDFLKSAFERYSTNLNPSTFADTCLKISNERNERIVFIIDEMGAYATSQKDSDDRLLQLQGISESFASVGKGKLWLIVTSQEKLNDIAQTVKKRGTVSKITDRFPIKLDLTSENVEEVVRKKMLAKKPDVIDELKDLFDSKKGNIQTISDTKGRYPKTDKFENFKDYYPFFDYQIKMLPDLIESSIGSNYAEASERKLISIVDTILKRLKDEEHTRCVNLVDIFDSLGVNFFGSGKIERINRLDKELKDFEYGPIKPSDVMKALEVIKRVGKRMNSSEEVLARALVSNLNQNVYETQKNVRKCVEMLEELQLVTVDEGNIDLVSDVEKDFMESWKNQIVSTPEIKKRIAGILENILNLNFSYMNGPSIPIEWSYNDKKWGKSGGISIKILPFESNVQFEKLVEDTESESANRKETIYVILASADIEDEIEKLEKLEKALKEFQMNKNSSEFREVQARYERTLKGKTREVEKEIRDSLNKGILIYYYEKKDVNGKLKDSIKDLINSKVVKNYYPNITSEKAKMQDVKDILKNPKKELAMIRDDEDHRVFDEDGELIESHKLINPIITFLNTRKRGADVLDTFSKAPYGWAQETIMYAIAAMLRDGKIKVNGSDDYSDPQIISTLITPSKLKSAALSLNVSIPIEQKDESRRLFNEILESAELEVKDPNSKFFKIGEKAITKLIENARYVRRAVQPLGVNEEFDVNWLNSIAFKLRNEDPEALNLVFSRKDEIRDLNLKINEEKEFLDKNLDNLKKEKDFIDQIIDEIEKASSIDNKSTINNYTLEFKKMLPNLMMYKDEISGTFEKIRNEYKKIFTPFHEEKEKLFGEFNEILKEASQKKNALGEIVGEQKWFLDCKHEIKGPCPELKISYSPKCENCKLGLYETQLLIPKIKNDLEGFKEKLEDFMRKKPEEKVPTVEETKIIKLKKKMTYGELKKEISKLSTGDDTVIEIEVEG